MKKIKTGFGYDVHRLVEDRPLILGGVVIPYEKGLEGHSDADVVLHAVCDALLGALGKGDIGEHFPNDDSQYKNVSSLLLLEHVYKILIEEGFLVSNVDIMLLSEKPNIKPYKSNMRFNIATRLNISPDEVNMKATTNEKMGFIGREEGMACMANVLIHKEF